MKLKALIRRYRIYLWIWVAYIALWLIVDVGSHPSQFLLWWLNELWRGVFVLVVNIFFFEYVLKKLSSKRIIYSVFLVAFQIFLFSAGLFMWRQLGVSLGIHTPFRTYKDVGEGIGDQFGASLFAVIFFAVIRHIYAYNKLKRVAQELRIQKQEAELNYLKSQTNPHFLFNTLNNIYSLSLDKSDLAPESILRLSKILRFMLYEASGDFIAIEQELKIISDYIDLERLRYDDTLKINFNHHIEDMRQALPPLLMIPLVENAFKHGVSETRNHPFVDIHLAVKDLRLKLMVKNSVDEHQDELVIKENIGLSNLRRQLQLLYTDFELLIERKQGIFIATLKINLSSHV
ncbi:MAG: histidine kinase [Chitinophagaceae bacterium]|nr:histidine kinase [Chitinophagaceae bacterium]